MSYSAKIRLRSDYGRDQNAQLRRTRADGTALLYLQVVIDRSVLRYDLALHWPPEHFDEVLGYCLPRHTRDTGHDEVNLIAQREVAAANEIFIQYRLRRLRITADDFRREYRTPLNKEDFLLYYATKVEARVRAHEIDYATYRIHLATLNVLKRLAKELPFQNLADLGLPAKLEKLLVADGRRQTTRWLRHQNTKAYLNLARNDDRIEFAWPYENFKVPKGKGRFRSLRAAELVALERYYAQLGPGTTERQVLRRWLFSLAAYGLRISDICRIEARWRVGDVVSVPVWKGRSKRPHTHLVILADRAKELWADALREQDHPQFVFTSLNGQNANEWLEVIGKAAGITSHLHNHAARKSFATHYMESGGQLHVLQEMMDHADISTTMLYVDVTPDARVRETNRINQVLPPCRDALRRRLGDELPPEPRLLPVSMFEQQAG